MSRLALCLIGILMLFMFVAFGSASSTRAGTERQPRLAGSPQDLINAVNALRASFGLVPYNVSAILMSTAQAQADFLAATGSMTHAGPGGIGLTDRLLAAGYPLAGDLSLGGFRAENITGGNESMPAEAAVDKWTGDALHLNTMVSQNLTEIGAGVAVSNGRVYYVIDAAHPTTSGNPPAVATAMAGGSPVPEIVPVIIPVTVSTPNAQGQLIHEVKPGQTLWQIAITYETKIDEIKRLNNLYDNNIYPGNMLLVNTGMIQPTAPPTLTQVVIPTATNLAISPAAMETTMFTPTAGAPSVTADDGTLVKVVLGIIALALVGAGIFAWLGTAKK